MYGFSKVGEADCEPGFESDESGDSESRVVSGAGPGDQYHVCVEFVGNDCMVSATINETGDLSINQCDNYVAKIHQLCFVFQFQYPPLWTCTL